MFSDLLMHMIDHVSLVVPAAVRYLVVIASGGHCAPDCAPSFHSLTSYQVRARRPSMCQEVTREGSAIWASAAVVVIIKALCGLDLLGKAHILLVASVEEATSPS